VDWLLGSIVWRGLPCRQLLEVRNASDQAERQFVWGTQYIDEAIVMDVDTDNDGDCLDAGGSKRYFYCQDGNYNVVALREGSNIVERYEYDPYGNVRIFKGYDSAAGHENLTVVSDSVVRDATDPPLAYGNPFLFAGYFHDNETGLYHVRHRIYSPTLARWLQRDPLGYVDGMNLHGYARTNPVRFRDPFGMGLLDSFWDWWCPKQCTPGCVKDVRFDYGLRWAWAKCDPK